MCMAVFVGRRGSCTCGAPDAPEMTHNCLYIINKADKIDDNFVFKGVQEVAHALEVAEL